MNAVVVVEGKFDQMLLEHLLADIKPRHPYVIEAVQGRDAARPIARKHLVRDRQPVVFVFDAETVDRARVQEQVDALQDYFQWNSGGIPFGVFAMVPMTEVIFFDRPMAIQRRLGHPIEHPLQTAGQYAPKQILQQSLLPQMGLRGLEDLVNSLDTSDIEDLRQHQTIQDIRKFIELLA